MRGYYSIVIFVFWIVYGQFVRIQLVDVGLFFDLYLNLWNIISPVVPSIGRLDPDLYAKGVFPGVHVAVMLCTIPILFVFLLPANVEHEIRGVREKNNEVLATLFLMFFCFSILFIGFGFSGPGKVFKKSLLYFSLLSSVMTYLPAYFLRLVFCIIFKK